ncbi:MAG: patatin-like phospholipase family protein [Bdellovibrionia bacterium]
MRLREKKKISLVLSGGGIKAAAFHIGACLALQEKGFRFAGGTPDLVSQRYPDSLPLTIRQYVGSSAGAFVASILASGYPVESLINAFELGFGDRARFETTDSEYLKPLKYRNIFNLNSNGLLRFLPDILLKKSLVQGGLEAMLKNGVKINGLFSTKALEQYLRKDALVHNEFSRLGVELYIIATQLNHTRKAIFGNFDEPSKNAKFKLINYATISEAVACSTALPPVFSPYGIPNMKGKEIFYYDGEIRDTLSTHVASDNGADLVIASYSIQPYHYSKKMGSLHEYGIPVILNQALYQVIQQKIVRHIEHRNEIKSIYQAIEAELKRASVDPQLRKQVLEHIERRAHFRPEVDHIYISPRPQDYEMFFVDHFSLNPKILERIVKIGFKSTLSALRGYEI